MLPASFKQNWLYLGTLSLLKYSQQIAPYGTPRQQHLALFSQQNRSRYTFWNQKSKLCFYLLYHVSIFYAHFNDDELHVLEWQELIMIQKMSVIQSNWHIFPWWDGNTTSNISWIKDWRAEWSRPSFRNEITLLLCTQLFKSPI